MKKLNFEMSGECLGFTFDPRDYIDVENITDLENEIAECAEDSVCWGVYLIGDTYEELWEQVQQAKLEQSKE